MAIVLFTSLLITALAQTLTLKDTEHPDALVNTDTTTALRLKIIIPEQLLVRGTNYAIRVELHNTGHRIEIVYMPALTMRPVFRPTKTSGLPDEFGPPMTFGRASAKEDALNYVVLMGGDYYGATYNWTPPASGEVTFHATYQNKEAGPTGKLPAWRGDLRENSVSSKIILK